MHGDAGCFNVTHFADHDHVGILSNNRSECRGKRQSNLGFGLDLIDPLELVLDRVFDGDDLSIGCVDLMQRRIERGAFTASGRAGDQDDAMGLLQDTKETIERLAFKTQTAKIEFDAFLVKQSDDDTFTVHGRHSRNTEVEFLALNLQFNAAVLWESAFGNVQFCHDFDA